MGYNDSYDKFGQTKAHSITLITSTFSLEVCAQIWKGDDKYVLYLTVLCQACKR